ncbi:MAG: damage-inducible protein DinB [Acidobacteria bacterium]|nr:MAG: damage-inducible protein DinB [Acidobacteriota bacterium]
MTIEDLRLLLDYHYWARDRMLEAVVPLAPEQFTRDMGSSFRSIRDTLAHIYAAEWAWYSRWVGHSPTALLPSDMFPDVISLRATWTDHEAKMRAYLETLGEAGLTRVIEYKLLNGQAGASPFWQMLQHVVNHASYHRGQVTTMLRQMGAAPGKPMDLIAFYRSVGSEGGRSPSKS